MSFPETRATLIRRIAEEGRENDWRQFLVDYWGPVCRFAAQRGNLSQADAEDVASQTFVALLGNQLLQRWVDNRAAKLRTMLCVVVRNILSNRARVQAGRAKLVGHQVRGDNADLPDILDQLDASDEQVDAFYAAWVEDLLENAIDQLVKETHAEGKGDYFRVLHGRLCEELSMPEIAEALGISVTSAENYFKAARKRLATILEKQVHEHVARYMAPEQLAEEFADEWRRLGEFLTSRGGLEQAVRASDARLNVADRQQRKTAQIQQTLLRVLH